METTVALDAHVYKPKPRLTTDFFAETPTDTDLEKSHTLTTLPKTKPNPRPFITKAKGKD